MLLCPLLSAQFVSHMGQNMGQAKVSWSVLRITWLRALGYKQYQSEKGICLSKNAESKWGSIYVRSRR